jgi:hypothetical protein
VISAQLKSAVNSEPVDAHQVARIKIVLEEEAIFNVIMRLQALDLLISLSNVGCNTLPYKSMFSTMNFCEIYRKLSKRQTIFTEIRRERKYREKFGFYGYKILKVLEWK